MAKRKAKGKVKQVKIESPLTKHQLKEFLDFFNGNTKTAIRNRLYFKTLLELGARSSEIVVMKFSNLHRDEDGDPYYHLETSKSGRGDFLPLSEKLYIELKALGILYNSVKSDYVFRPVSKNVPLKTSYVRRICAEAGEFINLPFRMHPHSLRRSFAYHLLKKTNGDIYTVSKLLRHSDIGSTQLYLSIYQDEKKKAVAGLFD